MKKVLQIIPYSTLYPPQNGGQLRCFHIMQQMSRYYHVDVLIHQKKQDIYLKGYENPNISFINKDDYPLNEGVFSYLPNRLKNALRFRWLTKTITEPATLEVLEFAHVIRSLAKNGKQYNSIVCEHLSALELSPILRQYFPKAKIIYDAHNVDYKLSQTEIERKRILKHEKRIYLKADSFWACSTSDVRELEELNNYRLNGFVIPNGVDTQARPFHKEKNPYLKNILFCGSLEYEPNREGIYWFYHQVWPLVKHHLSDVTLTIIGRGNPKHYDYLRNDSSIYFIGAVEDVVPYYEKAYVAIVPLLSGSGTRLKVLEAMSMGNPIVTTTIGIEGIEAENGKHAFIKDIPELFAEEIVNLIRNPNNANDIRNKARRLIDENYDWRIIGQHLKDNIC